ncbi:hypothetical protein HanIR_Chr05g0219911 [Helianthus annuus]|nr:hypothetical protein HanIR_Chr05g0219911 [Helianthus annuus]
MLLNVVVTSEICGKSPGTRAFSAKRGVWNEVTVVKRGFYPDSRLDTAPCPADTASCRARFLIFFLCSCACPFFRKWLEDLPVFDVHLPVRNMSGMMLSLFVNRLKRDFLFLILNGSSVEF